MWISFHCDQTTYQLLLVFKSIVFYLILFSVWFEEFSLNVDLIDYF